LLLLLQAQHGRHSLMTTQGPRRRGVDRTKAGRAAPQPSRQQQRHVLRVSVCVVGGGIRDLVNQKQQGKLLPRVALWRLLTSPSCVFSLPRPIEHKALHIPTAYGAWVHPLVSFAMLVLVNLHTERPRDQQASAVRRASCMSKIEASSKTTHDSHCTHTTTTTPHPRTCPQTRQTRR